MSMSGYQHVKMVPHSPSRVFTRVCSTVYAAAFVSGNQTAIVPLGQIPDTGEKEGGMPLPNVNHAGVPEPDMSLIVTFNGQH